MDRGRIAILSHTSDIDGVGSAALLIRRYGVPLRNIFFTEYTDSSVAYATGMIRRLAKKGISLYITDLGVSESREPLFADLVAYVRRKGGRVFWFDHHVWSKKGIDTIAAQCEIAVVGENPYFCAAEITRSMLELDDSYSKAFARIVHFSDFNLKAKEKKTMELVSMYAQSIASYNTLPRKRADAKLRHVAKVIAGGRLHDRTIAKDARRFEALSRKRMDYLLAHLYLGERVAVAFAKEKVNATHACNQIKARSRKEVVVLVDLFNGRGHFRTDSYDISGIARLMRGGGHPHAAGFTVDMRRFAGLRSEKQRLSFVSMIDRQIGKLKPEN